MLYDAVIREDAKVLMPKMAIWFIKRAAMKLPTEHRARWAEEWLGVTSDMELRSQIVWHAISCYWCAGRMAREMRGQETFYKRRGKRIFDLFVAFSCLPVMLPLMLIAVCVQFSLGRHPFAVTRYVGERGEVFDGVVMNVSGWRGYRKGDVASRANYIVANAIIRTGFYNVPLLWNVLRGEMSVIGSTLIREQRYNEAIHGVPICKPGLASASQLSSSTGKTGMRHRDYEYAQQMSLLSDVILLFKSPFVALGARSR